jgi:hypothetical protein
MSVRKIESSKRAFFTYMQAGLSSLFLLEGEKFMKMTAGIRAVIVVCLLVPILVIAQDTPVTLILKSGDEIQCRVVDVWKGEIYFEANSADDAYRFGDRVSIDNVAKVKLKDGRLLSAGEFVDYREGRRPVAPAAQTASQPVSTTPTKAEARVGMRLTAGAWQAPTEKTDSRIGLRLPEPPRPSGQQIILELSQLADMLAELGMAGRVLHETAQGALANRKLTDTQQRLVEAIKQSSLWQRRKSDLREAHQQAFTAFNAHYGKDTGFLRKQFDFEPQNGSMAFLEFVQYLHITAAANVESAWQKVEESLGRRGAAALADILNNYDDWYYLYGSELESR